MKGQADFKTVIGIAFLIIAVFVIAYITIAKPDWSIFTTMLEGAKP